MLRKILVASVAAAALLTAASGASAQMPKVLKFGIISTESSQALKAGFDPFLKDMEKALGVKVKPFFAPDYAGIIEGMRFDKVDIAWLGNKSALEAVDRAGAEIFAQTVDVTGNPGYWSLLLVHKDSTIKSLKDVLTCDKSLTFGNGDPNSTSGFLVPSYYVFAKNKVDPKACFKVVRNASHEVNAMAVANKQVDVATNNTESIDRLKKVHPKEAGEIREIWRSPLIPADPIVWRKNLDNDAKDKIYSFFLRYGRTGDLKKIKHEHDVLADMSSGWAPFIASSDLQLIPIRQMQAFRDKMKAEANTGMDPKEKAEKIAKLDAQLKALDELAKASEFRNAE
ncbi:MAG: phosphonate ABC transporter substrate-binding protein [Rhodospirillaceae bacterium]|nr:phosphonate ABC transporter substrate-binding protein [Rhodospirillaceae bacterium]